LRRSHRAAALRAPHPTISQFPKWCNFTTKLGLILSKIPKNYQMKFMVRLRRHLPQTPSAAAAAQLAPPNGGARREKTKKLKNQKISQPRAVFKTRRWKKKETNINPSNQI